MSRDAFVDLFSSFVHEAQTTFGFDTDDAHVLLAKARLALAPLQAVCTETHDAVATLERRLTHRLAMHGSDRRQFLALDHQCTGFLRYEDFQRGLDNLNIPNDPVTVARLLLKYDTTGCGRVNYTSFVRLDYVDEVPEPPPSVPTLDELEEAERWQTEQAIALLRAKLYQRCRSRRQLYLHFDQNRYAYLSVEELQAGLRALGVAISKHELRRITAACAQKEDMLSLQDFCRLMDGLTEASTQLSCSTLHAAVSVTAECSPAEPVTSVKIPSNDVHREVVAGLLAQGKSTRALYHAVADADGMSVRSLERALMRWHLPVPPPASLLRLLGTYDTNGSGTIAYHEFVAFLHP
ncbi:hypothetical protein ACHHYP_03505 [Achlya hypogyna]|uniref:Uncharacterized protein n=1 Tax=Achlya hypogyna TaxID=1202772 RepID=A0A1V9Z414_ACHHY|nr:hypothetical protein ACHHYP_03505 [Achlya hypogyna]